MASVDVENLPQKTHGYIDYREFPYKVRINWNDWFGRQRLTVAHELLHGGNRIHKWNLIEHQIHEAALFTLSIFEPEWDGSLKHARQLVNTANMLHGWDLEPYQERDFTLFLMREVLPNLKKLDNLKRSNQWISRTH